MAKTSVTNSIRELRAREMGMTQQDLAERVGVSRQTIVAIEKARYSPTLELAFRIAGVFDESVERVFGYVNAESKSKSSSAGTE